MPDKTQQNRQDELERILAEAMQNPSLLEAMEAFEMGQVEYLRALGSTKSIKMFSGDSSNPGGGKKASMDPN